MTIVDFLDEHFVSITLLVILGIIWIGGEPK